MVRDQVATDAPIPGRDINRVPSRVASLADILAIRTPGVKLSGPPAEIADSDMPFQIRQAKAERKDVNPTVDVHLVTAASLSLDQKTCLH